MLVFVTQKSLRRPIDEMGRAAGGALQQDKAVAWRSRIIFDPMLHALMSDRTRNMMLVIAAASATRLRWS